MCNCAKENKIKQVFRGHFKAGLQRMARYSGSVSLKEIENIADEALTIALEKGPFGNVGGTKKRII